MVSTSITSSREGNIPEKRPPQATAHAPFTGAGFNFKRLGFVFVAYGPKNFFKNILHGHHTCEATELIHNHRHTTPLALQTLKSASRFMDSGTKLGNSVHSKRSPPDSEKVCVCPGYRPFDRAFRCEWYATERFVYVPPHTSASMQDQMEEPPPWLRGVMTSVAHLQSSSMISRIISFSPNPSIPCW